MNPHCRTPFAGLGRAPWVGGARLRCRLHGTSPMLLMRPQLGRASRGAGGQVAGLEAMLRGRSMIQAISAAVLLATSAITVLWPDHARHRRVIRHTGPDQRLPRALGPVYSVADPRSCAPLIGAPPAAPRVPRQSRSWSRIFDPSPEGQCERGRRAAGPPRCLARRVPSRRVRFGR